MLVDDAPARGHAVTGPDDVARKYAMLSVYYATLGRRFAVSGAPSIAVPPEVSPQSLAEALEVLSGDEQRLEQALWLVVRNTGIRQSRSRKRPYPAEIDRYLTREEQDELDQLRRTYRVGASIFAGCLRACRDGDRVQFDALQEALSGPKIVGNKGFAEVAKLLFDQSPEDYLATMRSTSAASKQWRLARRRIVAIEEEVARSIATYVEELADTAAYEAFVELLGTREGTSHPPLAIYPVTSSITQSIEQLWTSATVTTLAHGDFTILEAAVDPANWHVGNDVIKDCFYVDDPLTLQRTTRDLGRSGRVHGLLYEEAAMSWGRESTQQASFRNVLNVSRKIAEDPLRDESITVDFSLCRSISSEVLWDSRSGGITLNEGFMKVVPLGDGRWRVTSRKLLRFSDRTPYSGATGWADFGQMLNYLAPAALSWWVETETYSLGHRATTGEQAAELTSVQGDEDGTR